MLTRLLILWLLSEQSLHGYRIKRILDEETLALWFPTKVGSIYAVLRTLVREGHVQAIAVEREGKRPERTRYAITGEGRRHFEELLRSAWASVPTFSDPIDAALAALPELEDDEVDRLVAQRAEGLCDRLRRFAQFERAPPAHEIVQRRRALLEAELSWTEELLARRQKERTR